MTKILKNIAYGVGSVFVDISSGREYPEWPKNGFREDARNLRNDSRAVIRETRASIAKASNGKLK